jgi:hypothetical protein
MPDRKLGYFKKLTGLNARLDAALAYYLNLETPLP